MSTTILHFLRRCGDIQGNQPQGRREQIVENVERKRCPPLPRCGCVQSGGHSPYFRCVLPAICSPEGSDEEGVADPDDGIEDEVAGRCRDERLPCDGPLQSPARFEDAQYPGPRPVVVVSPPPAVASGIFLTHHQNSPRLRWVNLTPLATQAHLTPCDMTASRRVTSHTGIPQPDITLALSSSVVSEWSRSYKGRLRTGLDT